MNDLVCHDTTSSSVPIKLPSDIPMFKGKTGEDPGDHVMTFHLWCSYNSPNNDSIRLILFQRNLTSVVAKWYIKFSSTAYDSFLVLATIFLKHFQLLVRYDADTNLLLNFQKNMVSDISNHIQERRKRNRIIKANIPLEFLLECFLKYLLPYI